MANLAIISFLVGAVFGTRFKVLVLVPLAIFGGLNTLLVTLIVGEPFDTALLNSLVVIVALQGGYLFGSATRWTIAAARASRTDEVDAHATEAHATAQVRDS